MSGKRKLLVLLRRDALSPSSFSLFPPYIQYRSSSLLQQQNKCVFHLLFSELSPRSHPASSAVLAQRRSSPYTSAPIRSVDTPLLSRAYPFFTLFFVDISFFSIRVAFRSVCLVFDTVGEYPHRPRSVCSFSSSRKVVPPLSTRCSSLRFAFAAFPRLSLTGSCSLQPNMYSSQRSSSVLPPPSSRPTKRVASSSLSTAQLARKVFQQKYSLQLAPGVITWLEELVAHFGLQDEEEIVETFEHLVKGCVGSGSGLGTSPSSSLEVGDTEN